MWERAKSIRNGRAWVKVAQDMVKTMPKTWPAALCTDEQAASVAVKLDVVALRDRFKGLWKVDKSVGALRVLALEVVQKTQLYLPPEAVPLWTFFRTGENTVVNKGGLAKQQAELARAKKGRLRSRRKTAPPRPVTPTPAAKEKRATQAPVTTQSVESDEEDSPPGLQRGGDDGRGRGGAIPIETKGSGTTPDGHGDVPLPDASSPESDKQGSPYPKQPCMADPSASGGKRKKAWEGLKGVCSAAYLDCRRPGCLVSK